MKNNCKACHCKYPKMGQSTRGAKRETKLEIKEQQLAATAAHVHIYSYPTLICLSCKTMTSKVIVGYPVRCEYVHAQMPKAKITTLSTISPVNLPSRDIFGDKSGEILF